MGNFFFMNAKIHNIPDTNVLSYKNYENLYKTECRQEETCLTGFPFCGQGGAQVQKLEEWNKSGKLKTNALLLNIPKDHWLRLP